jgi:2-(1,2-epoxy-1,2-dihydrophenyl)acetyl-CoA isomerase
MLPRLLGFHRAMEVVLLNPKLDAQRAVDLGLANALFPAAVFEESVLAVAAQLADGPPRAWSVAKGLIGQAAGMDRLDTHLDRELDHLSRIANGEEFAEGLASFFEKRAPRFVRS